MSLKLEWIKEAWLYHNYFFSFLAGGILFYSFGFLGGGKVGEFEGIQYFQHCSRSTVQGTIRAVVVT